MDTENIAGSTEKASGPELICPVCSALLAVDEKRAHCPSGHSFDRAKEGYLNLLLANQKGSNDPGDDRESVAARRAFLSSGHYDFLVEALRPHVAEGGALLDAGCGEGHFLGSLASAPSVGIDISRSAVRLAARSNPGHTWLVANVARRIPVADAACDIILSVMAPRNAAEFHRILRPGGSLVCVIPGPDHLGQLTSLLMDHDPNQSAKPKALADSLSPHFSPTEEARVSQSIHADQPTINRLITMTPLRWKSRKEALAEAAAIESLEVTTDFRILRFGRT